MAYKVLQIVTCDTIKVSPEWRVWKLAKGGDQIRINGCQLPKDASSKVRSKAKSKLHDLLNGATVQIKNIYKVEGKVVTADVFLRGKNVGEQFSQPKQALPAAEASEDSRH
jgi:hypothetical protein